MRLPASNFPPRYDIAPTDQVPIVPRLAGEEILSATIIVGEPNPLVAGIHDRMSVMLVTEDYDRWLDPTMTVDELRALLKPYEPELMKAYEVSRAVNSVKNDTPECVEPLA